MSSNRQDAWSQQEDELLAKVVLDSITNGQTQLDAFANVGQQLKRTAAACGFRWNSYVRKLHENDILLAKKLKKENRKKKKLEGTKKNAEAEVVKLEQRLAEQVLPSLEEMVGYVETLYSKLEMQLIDSNRSEKNENIIFDLQEKIHHLVQEKNELLEELEQVKAEFNELADIFKKAKTLVGN